MKPILLILLVCSISYSNFDSLRIVNHNTINILLGDVSATEKYGGDLHDLNPTQRVTTHLEYVVNLLKSKKTDQLSQLQITNRSKNISRLQTYITQKQYPINTAFNHNQPIFIDKQNQYCAVGHLIKKSLGVSIAKELNDKFKFDYIYDMKSEILNGWASQSGFSLEELQMIQPSYACVPFVPHTYKKISDDLVQVTNWINMGCESSGLIGFDTLTRAVNLLPELKAIYESSSIVFTGTIIHMEYVDSNSNLVNVDSLLNTFEWHHFFKHFQYVIGEVVKGDLISGDTLWTKKIPVTIWVEVQPTIETHYFDNYSTFSMYYKDSHNKLFAPHVSPIDMLGINSIPLIYATPEEVDDFVSLQFLTAHSETKIITNGRTIHLSFENPSSKDLTILNSKGQVVHQNTVSGLNYTWTAPTPGKHYIKVGAK